MALRNSLAPLAIGLSMFAMVALTSSVRFSVSLIVGVNLDSTLSQPERAIDRAYSFEALLPEIVGEG